jgi:hypothetical protein
MAKTGRSKTWNPTDEEIQKIESLAARGMEEQHIALCLDIHPCTLSKKKAEFEQLSQAIKRGKAKGIANVTAALLKNVNNGNVTAQIFYLKCQAQWREAREEDNSNELVRKDIADLKEALTQCKKMN